MIGLTALEEIWDTVGTFRKGQFFYVVEEDYANTLVAQKRAVFAEAPVSRPIPKVALSKDVPTVMTIENTTPKAPTHFAGLHWPGATLVIMASGPSLSESQVKTVQDWRGEPNDARKVAVINTTFRLAPWADLLYACDDRWWKIYYDEVAENFPSAEKWTQDAETLKWATDVKRIPSQRAAGLSTTTGMIHQGMNSGYQMIGLAVQAKVKKIILLGYDMKAVGKMTHWHGDHPNPINAANPYKQWIDHFDKLADDLKAHGVEVINATPSTALNCFPKKPLAEALA